MFLKSFRCVSLSIFLMLICVLGIIIIIIIIIIILVVSISLKSTKSKSGFLLISLVAIEEVVSAAVLQVLLWDRGSTCTEAIKICSVCFK